MRILATLLTPDSGHAEVAGFDVVRQANKVRAAIGLAGQYAAVDEYLTGFENIEMVGRLTTSPGRPAGGGPTSSWHASTWWRRAGGP